MGWGGEGGGRGLEGTDKARIEEENKTGSPPSTDESVVALHKSKQKKGGRVKGKRLKKLIENQRKKKRGAYISWPLGIKNILNDENAGKHGIKNNKIIVNMIKVISF